MLIRDSKGRLWSSRLTIGTARFLRDDLDMDIMRWLADWDTAIADLCEPATVATYCYGLMHDKCVAAGVTDRQFGAMIGCNSHGDLVEAIVADLTTFAAVPETLPGSPGKGGKTSPDALWGRVYQSSAIVGVDPAPFTLGELMAMADTQSKIDSARNAVLCAVIVQSQGGKSKPEDFDGTGFLKHQAQQSVEVLENIHELGAALGIKVGVRRADGKQQ